MIYHEFHLFTIIIRSDSIQGNNEKNSMILVNLKEVFPQNSLEYNFLEICIETYFFKSILLV